MSIDHKRPAFAFFVRASVANKQNSTAEVRGLGAQGLRVGPELACYVHKILKNLYDI